MRLDRHPVPGARRKPATLAAEAVLVMGEAGADVAGGGIDAELTALEG